MDRPLIIIGLVLVLGISHVSPVLAAESVDNKQGTTARKDQMKELIELAYILAGKEVAIEHFNGLDLTAARRVRFVSPSVATDLSYMDKIHDPCNFEVERTVYDFSGRVAKIEIISLSKAEFFARLGYVKNYLEKNGSFPTMIESWQVKEQLGSENNNR